ncbi:hypothetical protein EJ069_29185 [Mesorhizobium sp. M2A.F.Ca.ET.043.05.1.1]|nr:hypothetical protein [Mesorhizobium sp. M2A.F.Ca.ET.043.05.1.1]AZO18366.1 hypothetical protein EJ069_29185 [Mesorhizobium sp. M2A.F.Ca.ET.043.05.1.1]
MTKLLALVICGIMLIQVIKPLGWPGLALLAMAAISLAAVLGHWA